MTKQTQLTLTVVQRVIAVVIGLTATVLLMREHRILFVLIDISTIAMSVAVFWLNVGIARNLRRWS